jgi:hypothetical protein
MGHDMMVHTSGIRHGPLDTVGRRVIKVTSPLDTVLLTPVGGDHPYLSFFFVLLALAMGQNFTPTWRVCRQVKLHILSFLAPALGFYLQLPGSRLLPLREASITTTRSAALFVALVFDLDRKLL